MNPPARHSAFGEKTLLLFQALNVDSSNILLRSDDFYQQHGIEVWTRKEVSSAFSRSKNALWLCLSEETCFVWQVVSVNVADKTVKLHDGTVQPYTQLLISTGCRLET